MRPNFLRLGWRQLRADPGYTAVVVGGLALAVACCHLVAVLAIMQFLPDPALPEPDRVVSLEFKGNIPGQDGFWFENAPVAFGPALVAAGAPVTDLTRTTGGEVSVQAEGRVAKLQVVLADPGVRAVFGLHALRGDLDEALRRPDAIALVPEAAARLFGTADPIGRTLTVRGFTYTVVALLPRPASRSALHFEGLARFDSPANPMPPSERTNEWYGMDGDVYARLAPGHAAREVGDLAQSVFDHGPAQAQVPKAWTEGGRHGAFLRAIPMSRKNLDGATGDKRKFAFLMMIGGALLVLALAVANYVNLTTVRTLRRQREIAIRKTLGAGPGRLVAQFVAESMLVVAVAAAAGLALAWELAPAVGDFIEDRLDDDILDAGPLLALALGVVVLGVLTGLYPARVALRVRCAEALAGRAHDEGATGRFLRRAMTALQFTIALVLAGVTCELAWQIHHVDTRPLGFAPAPLMGTWLPDDASPAARRAFRDALAHDPAVSGLAWSSEVLGGNEVGRIGTFTHADRSRVLRQRNAEPAFFETYGMRLVAGTPRAPAAAAPGASAPSGEPLVVLDEAGVKALGFASAVDALGAQIGGGGSFLQAGNDRLRVVAVVGDSREEGVHQPAQPHLFFMRDGPDSVLTVRGPDPAALRRAIEAAWPRAFPGDAVALDPIQHVVDGPLWVDRRVAGMVAVAGALALLLAGSGVYALAAWTVRRSTREIVIRKLHGAGRGRIARLVAAEFVPLLAVAALAGWPLSAWLSESWLSMYVERAPGLAAVPVLGVVALLGVTALACARHAWIAMNLRPMEVLRG
jgi:cell division protein FtsX